MLLKDVLLRTRRVLSLYRVNGDSVLLVLNGTSLNSVIALLALGRPLITMTHPTFLCHLYHDMFGDKGTVYDTVPHYKSCEAHHIRARIKDLEGQGHLQKGHFRLGRALWPSKRAPLPRPSKKRHKGPPPPKKGSKSKGGGGGGGGDSDTFLFPTSKNSPPPSKKKATTTKIKRSQTRH